VIYGISYAHFKTRKFPKIVPNWTLDRVSEKKLAQEPQNYRAYTSLNPNLKASICLAMPLLTVASTT